MVETVSSWVLPESSQFRRQPALSPELRQPTFDGQFDARTVFYDCFRVNVTQVMLIGPPLKRFPGTVDSLTIRSLPTGNECPFEVRHKHVNALGNRRIDNVCEVLVEVPAGDIALHLQADAGHITIEIKPNACELFRGKRVLVTLSKNNHPQWVCDWMRFHRDMQSADAVLLYDNDSTAYRASALLEEMQQVSGFKMICVVAWPHKYGGQGIGRRAWDDAFSQGGVLEDARWRYLAEAYGVVNCDVDELVLSSEGNIFDKAAASPTGHVKFAGRWVTPSVAANGSTPRHQESTGQLPPRWRWRAFRLKDTYLCPTKWAIAPNRCPADAHWGVHQIIGLRTRTMKQDDTCYRHCTRVSTNWKNNRDMIERDAAQSRPDIELEQAFARVRWEE